MIITSQHLQQANDLVDKMAAMSAASAEDIAKIKEALPSMINGVAADGVQQHVHTGLINATVRQSPDCLCVRVNVTTPAGRAKMDTAHLEAA
jgi:hypothetical protein